MPEIRLHKKFEKLLTDKRIIVIILLVIAPLIVYSVTRQTNFLSKAASVFLIEAETGTPDTEAMIHDDTAASGGKYVMFSGSQPSPLPTGITQANQVTLIDSYYYPETFRVSNTGYYGLMKYRPRSFINGKETGDKIQWSQQKISVVDAKRFAGWDILNLPNEGVFTKYAGDDLTTITLNRPAEIAIVWISNTYIPQWLKSWTLTDTVSLNIGSRNVYTKKVAAGDLKIGGLFDTGNVIATPVDLPIVLIGEQDSTPSKEPTVPSGLTKPIVNQPCPSWVHDQYTTPGPDGKTYATWHPQIDPVYWCYFGHEHGANPDNFLKDYKVAYNYTAGKQGHEHPGEGHVGFKTFVFDDSAGRTWLITLHFGTGSLARVCNRFHSADVAVKNTTGTEILADIHFMGDFGQAVEHNTSNLLQPPSCPNQGVGVPTRGDGSGQRQIPVHGDGSDGYEPWAIGAKGNILGFKAGWHINTHDPQIICDTLACANNHVTGATGSRRFVADVSLLGIVAGVNTGTFYTNALGTALTTSSDPLGLKQYVKPGISLINPDAGKTCIPYKGWGRKELCLPSLEANAKMETYTRENSIQIPN